MDIGPDSHFQDLGRRLHAAYESYRLGLARVDSTMKRYEEVEFIGEYWVALARLVDRDSNEAAKRILDKMTLPTLRLMK